MPVSREVHLIERPKAMPTVDQFQIVETNVPDAADGEVLVQNLYMSVDPAMRPRLTAGQDLGVAMMGGALGRVVQSKNGDYAVGDLVSNRLGFREYFTSDGKGLTKLTPDPDLSLTTHMHALGMTGFTAYGGILHIGALKDGEQVFVSTAGGAVGSIAAQIAKIKNCYVVGSTGSAEKAAWLKDEVGLDAVINYKDAPIRGQLEAATPKGIDVYFDNVGGDHLEAALRRMNTLGRIPVCGFISGYNSGHSNVSNLSNIIYSRVMLRGFVGTDFMHMYGDFQRDMAGWLKDGRVKYQETVLEGINNAPKALIGLMEGLNAGKMLVKLAD
ncbi:MAG: NADP-dependent oxidoreductase [Phenylobacterium sp.]|uniref:NADP-dependent oxidoreductase n=1 Tax=Phenylobacterium sp. TaxID=1871053 RepID=UPI0027220771|nr:NADP-dependent oxidoreductase [Phenylobacterium sp.]MDO8913309.1 NADP-dependent oxidoreductase [Phenylobacterium sp.]MDP3102545.1 NADP-dependent oxidoreductase [Phenylobacterium sp.]HQT54330.1 NADP-dependent oxidoreductase [Phenylobacterium sp.]